MSSHHIVRDDQEPALIIANGASCNIELLGQLLEWSPLVIVLDSAIERVVELGIKVDVLLGDFDRGFDANYYKETQFPLEIIHTPDQNKTDLEKAFDYLIERKMPAVNVVWATGKRADHTITNLTNITRYRDLLKIVVLAICRLIPTFHQQQIAFFMCYGDHSIHYYVIAASSSVSHG